jgi:hypothetical protein
MRDAWKSGGTLRGDGRGETHSEIAICCLLVLALVREHVSERDPALDHQSIHHRALIYIHHGT